MAEFNAVTILFKLLSEDNLSGGFNQARNAINGLNEGVTRGNISLNQMREELAGVSSLSEESQAGIMGAFDGTNEAVAALNADLERLREEMIAYGATTTEINEVTTALERQAMVVQDRSLTGISRLSKGISGISMVAGAAFMMAGYYLENFVQQCLTAATTIQQQNMEIGASMGLNAVQSLQQGPAIQAMLTKTEAETGQNIQQLRQITPSVGLVAGGNMALTNQDLQAISAITYAKPGATLEEIAPIFNKMVTQGSPMAMGSFGLSLQDMGTTTAQFKALDPKERQDAIDNAIMKKLGFMNSDVASTTAAQIQEFQGNVTQFEATLGVQFIPTLNVLMAGITDLMVVIDDIPGLAPVISTILLIVTGLALLAGPMLIIAPLLSGYEESMAIIQGLMVTGSGLFTTLEAETVAYLTSLAAQDGEITLTTYLNGLYSASLDAVGVSASGATASQISLASAEGAVWGVAVWAAGGLSLLGAALSGVLSSALEFVFGAEGLESILTYFWSTIDLAAGGLGRLTLSFSEFIPVLEALGDIIDPWLGLSLMAGSGQFKTTGNAPNILGGLNIHIPDLEEMIWGSFQKGNSNGMQMLNKQIDSWFRNLPGRIANDLGNIGGQMYKYGKNLLTMFGKGIKDSIPGLNTVLAVVADHFPRSPPKLGPLATITPEGTISWISGVLGGMYNGISGALNSWDKAQYSNYHAQQSSPDSEASWWSSFWKWGTSKDPNPKMRTKTRIGDPFVPGQPSGLNNVGANIAELMAPLKAPLDNINRNLTGAAGYIQSSVHYHSHGPIQIDASHMSAEELMSLMIYVNEKYLLPNTLPTNVKPAATTVPATTKSVTNPQANTQISAINPLGGTTKVDVPTLPKIPSVLIPKPLSL